MRGIKFIVILCLLSFNSALAVHLYIPTMVTQYAENDQEISKDDVFNIINDVRAMGIPNYGLTSDCEILAEVKKAITILNDDELNLLYNGNKVIEFNYNSNEYSSMNYLFDYCGFKKNNVFSKDNNSEKFIEKIQEGLDSIFAYEGYNLYGSLPSGVRVLANNLNTISDERRTFGNAKVSSWINQNEYVNLELKGIKAGDNISVWAEDELGNLLASSIVKAKGYGERRKLTINLHWLSLVEYGVDNFYLYPFSPYAVGEPNLKLRFYSSKKLDKPNRNSFSNLSSLNVASGIINISPLEENFLSEGLLDEYGKFAYANVFPKMNNGHYIVYAQKEDSDMWELVGNLYPPLETDIDPDQVHLIEESDSTYFYQTSKKFSGPLFDEAGASISDVSQGWISDCYFAGALRAVAAFYPEKLLNREIIRENSDGTYSVFFRNYDYVNWRFSNEKTEIKLRSYFPATSDGKTLYMQGTPKGPHKMELWGPLIEKAYAIFMSNIKSYYGKLTYDSIGGSAAAHLSTVVMGRLVGGSSETSYMNAYNSVTSFKEKILNELKIKDQVIFFDSGYVDYAKSRFLVENIAANHQYVVLDYDQEKDLLKVTNPWGQFEPVQDGKDDGVFYVSFEKLFRTMLRIHIHSL